MLPVVVVVVLVDMREEAGWRAADPELRAE